MNGATDQHDQGPLRVMLAAMNVGKGGVFNVVHALALGLRSRGHEVLLLTDWGDQLDLVLAEGFRHATAPFLSSFRALPRARAAVRRALAEFEPDILHAHSRWPSTVCMLAGRRPDVSTLHADTLTSHASALDRGPLRRWLSVWGRAVVTLDERAKRMLVEEQGIDPDSIHVIPNGADPLRFVPADPPGKLRARSRLGVPAEARVGVFVGSMDGVKRPALALRALRAAIDAGVPDAWLVLVGGGPLFEPARALAAELGVGDRCVFLGWVDPLEAYHAADLLVLPSRTEGFGLVCVEAMLCGVPVVRTRRGGCDQQIVEGVTGWSAEAEDEEGLCAAFARALGDPEALRRCGVAARRRALERFTLEAFLDRTIDLYRRVARPARVVAGGPI
jgi:D-inositol-3-phosphate glycosyltransferase